MATKQTATKTKGKLTLPTTTKKAVPVKKGLFTKPAKGKSIAVAKDDPNVFVTEFARVKECATCDCFELVTEGEGVFFHRKNDPQRVYLKHAALRADHVRITVEILK